MEKHSEQLKSASQVFEPPLEGLEEESLFSKPFVGPLAKVIQKWPSVFDQELVRHLQRYMVLSEKEFRAHRSLHHQLRILCSHYLMKKGLIRRKRLFSHEVDIEVRLVPTRLNFPFGKKRVLSIVMAIRLSSSYERFEETHILHAVQKIVPDAQLVKESFLALHKPGELLQLLYIEVEKTRTPAFAMAEVILLKRLLKEELRRHVETLNPSIFGVYDVEETMRSIFSLSQELQQAHDLPQVMISFERTLATTLVFRIIAVRALDGASRALPDCFKTVSQVEYIHERSSIIGHLTSDESVAKEASVFRLQIPKKPFLLRSDSSFNFYRARLSVLSFVTQALGEVRDFNGGIFSKQLELFSEFKKGFQEIAEKNPELLEDFFYGLGPPEMQAIISLACLKELFGLFLEAQREELPSIESAFIKTQTTEDALFVMIRFRDPAFQERLDGVFKEHQLAKELTVWVNLKDTVGYVYHTPSREKKEWLCQLLHQAEQAWRNTMQSVQILRLSPQHLPVSLDPRLGGDEISSVILKMLFEGLTRIGKDGKPELAIAKSVVISQDGKVYVFKLKETVWTNGNQVTAHDFCHAWKKLLSPDFTSPFAYLFYVILNAKKAKEGKVSVDDVGVEALDDLTLRIRLQHPCSYFLELIAHPFYFPVNHQVDQLHPNWPLQTGQAYVCNGPFQLMRLERQENYELKKNPLYWDHEVVKLDRIQISRANGREALEMFRKQEIDWIGLPVRGWEPFFSDIKDMQIEEIPFDTTYWYLFNTNQAPFHSRKLRQAFAYALDRQKIVESLSYSTAPAWTPLPRRHSQFSSSHQLKRAKPARVLFEEALQELGMRRQDLPPLILIHTNNELRTKIAQLVTQQWQEVLGISVQMEGYSFKCLFSKMTRGEYQIGSMSWWPKVDDPVYTLSTFKEGKEEINFSKWENRQYYVLLEKANAEMDLQKRQFLLAKAEALLIREAPVIPIVHETVLFIKQKCVEGIFPSKIGTIDFRYAFINRGVKYANSQKPLRRNI